jgi:hypothetical protein
MRQKYRNMLASSFHYAILLLASMTLIKNQLGTNAMSTTASSSGCLVEGDMMFAPGQSYGSIMGFHCHNKSTYLGKQTICGTSGSMVDVENNFTCPSHASNCVQCGDYSAICISDMTAVTEECASANGGSITSYPPVMNVTAELAATLVTSSTLVRRVSNLSSRLVPTLLLLSILL